MVTGTENERRQRRGMARGAVVAALAVGSAAVVLVATMSGEVPVLPREPSASSAPSETEPVDASARQAPPLTPRDARGSDRHLLEQQTSALRVAASATLDRRAAAALARDAAGYLATADAASGEAYAAQQSAAANLSRLPLAEFGYRVNTMWPDPARPGAYLVDATLTQRLAVEPEAQQSGRRLTMLAQPTGWTGGGGRCGRHAAAVGGR